MYSYLTVRGFVPAWPGILALLVLLSFPSVVAAVPISPGLYSLHSHPDGNQNPPPYGMRLDELFNVTAGTDIFSFDFSAAGSSMFLDYDGSSLHIFGTAFGGRDAGTTYFNDIYKGIYAIDFTYSFGVQPVPGDTGGFEDLWVPHGGMTNTGTITAPASAGAVAPFALTDKSNGTFTFRLGDESDGLGHRGFSGISGWGWLSIDGKADGPTRDFLFTATPVPEPSTFLLLALGLACLIPIRYTRAKGNSIGG